jgi:hypothetical protein
VVESDDGADVAPGPDLGCSPGARLRMELPEPTAEQERAIFGLDL